MSEAEAEFEQLFKEKERVQFSLRRGHVITLHNFTVGESRGGDVRIRRADDESEYDSLHAAIIKGYDRILRALQDVIDGEPKMTTDGESDDE